MADPQVQDLDSRSWQLGPGGYTRALGDNPDDISYIGMDCKGPELHERVEVVPRAVAERLAEALAVIAADTHDYETAEGGRTWRVKLAHETEKEFRVAYPPREETTP